MANTNPQEKTEDGIKGTETNSLVLTIKVGQAVGLKGSRASLNSFMRVQFADYDYKDVYI